MSQIEPITITITADTTAFVDGMRKAMEQLNELAPFAWRVRLASQRHQSRVVTRRKQRNHW